jgi:hypothetical protein
MNPSLPILKIEIEHARQCFHMAFQEMQFKLDEQFKTALEEATKPEKIQALLTNTADLVMKQVIDEEVRNFFAYGAGRHIVAEKVKEVLSKCRL